MKCMPISPPIKLKKWDFCVTKYDTYAIEDFNTFGT
jgi:hypothetical protein